MFFYNWNTFPSPDWLLTDFVFLELPSLLRVIWEVPESYFALFFVISMLNFDLISQLSGNGISLRRSVVRFGKITGNRKTVFLYGLSVCKICKIKGRRAENKQLILFSLWCFKCFIKCYCYLGRGNFVWYKQNDKNNI